MEAENKLYDQMHGDDGQQHEQLSPSQPPPPQYTVTTVSQATAYPPPYQGYPSSAVYPPSQGYGPTYPYTTPTIASAPYYAPPSGAGHPEAVGYGVPAPTQLLQQVTLVSANRQAPVVKHVSETFARIAVIYSCFVCWCCNWPFGLVGLILASL